MNNETFMSIVKTCNSVYLKKDNTSNMCAFVYYLLFDPINR